VGNEETALFCAPQISRKMTRMWLMAYGCRRILFCTNKPEWMWWCWWILVLVQS